MGRIIRIQCTHCLGTDTACEQGAIEAGKNHWMLALGIGFLDSPENVFYGTGAEAPLLLQYIRSSKMKKVALSLLSAGGEPEQSYGFRIYGCPSCRSLFDRFRCTISHAEGVWSPSYQCPRCKKTMLLLELPEEGERTLLVDQEGNSFPLQCGVCGGTDFFTNMLAGVD